MAHFDKHSTSIKALVDVSEAMLNAMEQYGIDPETQFVKIPSFVFP